LLYFLCELQIGESRIWEKVKKKIMAKSETKLRHLPGRN